MLPTRPYRELVDEQVRYASGNYDVFYAKRPKTHLETYRTSFKEAQTQMMMKMKMVMAVPIAHDECNPWTRRK